MLNKLEELLDHLNEQPNAAEGFSAKTLYVTGMQFGLTCKEVNELFLGKEKALSRGKYPASVPAEIVIAAANAPVKPVKVKAAKAPKVAKTKAAPKAKRNVSTDVITKKVVKDDAEHLARRELIAKIAKRHKAEDATIVELCSEPKSKDETADHTVIEELETLLKTSTVNPLSA